MKQIEIHTNSKNKSVYIVNPEKMTVTGGIFGDNIFPLKSWNYENSYGNPAGKIKFELSDGRVIRTSSVYPENIIEKEIVQNRNIQQNGIMLQLTTGHSTYFVNLDQRTVVGGPIEQPMHYINDPFGLNLQINREPQMLAFLAQKNIAFGKADECDNPGGAKFVFENGGVLSTSRIKSFDGYDFNQMEHNDPTNEDFELTDDQNDYNGFDPTDEE